MRPHPPPDFHHLPEPGALGMMGLDVESAKLDVHQRETRLPGSEPGSRVPIARDQATGTTPPQGLTRPPHASKKGSVCGHHTG
jgi:hypothetical protein